MKIDTYKIRINYADFENENKNFYYAKQNIFSYKANDKINIFKLLKLFYVKELIKNFFHNTIDFSYKFLTEKDEKSLRKYKKLLQEYKSKFENEIKETTDLSLNKHFNYLVPSLHLFKSHFHH